MVLPFNITSGSGHVSQVSFYAPPYEDVCSGARQGLDCELSLSVTITVQYTKEGEKEMLTAGCPGDSWHCVRGLWSGVYYHYACLGYDDSQMCQEGRGNCAYGGGSRCSPCPEGAVCPGKTRLVNSSEQHALTSSLYVSCHGRWFSCVDTPRILDQQLLEPACGAVCGACSEALCGLELQHQCRVVWRWL